MESRAYYFGNMYLSSIQQGIQAAHVTAEMFRKYRNIDMNTSSMLFDWAINHKVMVLLNAGYGAEISSLVAFFDEGQNPYPYAYFRESQEALDAALTCVGIILPDTVYETSKLIRENVVLPEWIERTGSVRYLKTGNGPVPLESSADLLAKFPDVEEVEYDLSKWEFKMACRLNNYGLAR